MLFAASFYITWLFFALVYYVICYVHGDLDPGKMNMQTENFTVCVLEIENFGKYIAIALMMIFLKILLRHSLRDFLKYNYVFYFF